VSATLELVDLSCKRGRRELFFGLQASVSAGQLLRVEGANGAGKTSLLRMLCGLLPPSAGQVRWRGQNVARLKDEFNAELLYLGHAPALKDDLTAAENLACSMSLAGSASSKAALGEALERAGLKGRSGLATRLLSQGQKRRAALARLELSADKSLWILDEPFNALDNAAILWLTALIERHLASKGTVVMTTHQRHAIGAEGGELLLSL
jgi:heme exporter protein A